MRSFGIELDAYGFGDKRRGLFEESRAYGISLGIETRVKQLEPQEPPKNVGTVYHYTSLSSWEQIVKQGVLEPRTSPWTWDTFGVCALRKIAEGDEAFWEKRYVVGGIDSPTFQPWREHGLHDELLDFVSKGYDQLALLSFPAEHAKGSFIREHVHTSQKRLTELLGEHDEKNFTTEQRIKVVKQTEKYYQSIKTGSQYDGSFQIPEIWIPNPINVTNITVVKTGSIADFR